MCGIWVELNARDPATAMRAIRQRGPDGEGSVTLPTPAGPLFMGHRRLAIYDPQPRSAQPMRRGPLTLVLNGAIYNFRALRLVLEQEGIGFETEGDTEVMLEAWRRWGPDCLPRIEGMFAAVVHDARVQRLWMMRDRFGEKPLYWRIAQEHGLTRLAVGSRLAQFGEAGIEHGVLGQFINQGRYCHESRSLRVGVSHVVAGSLVEVDLAGPLAKATIPQRFVEPWRRRTEDVKLAAPEAVVLLREALQKSVQDRLEADVPVGACLSGGIDSGLIASLAATSGSRLCCYTALPEAGSLDDPAQHEGDLAGLTARHAGVDWRPVVIADSDAPGLLVEASNAQDGPLASTSVLVQQAVFAAARNDGVLVMLDGQGADELLAGYSGVLGPQLADLLTGATLADVRAEADAFGIATPWRLALSTLVPGRLRAAIATLRNTQTARRKLALADWHELNAPRVPGQRRLDAYLEALVAGHSLPSLLAWEDNNAMHQGVETRLPFLAPGVVELAARMAAPLLLGGGLTKAVLRAAGQGLLPAEVLERRDKVAFAAPGTSWTGGVLRDWFEDGLSAAPRRLAGIIDNKRLSALLARRPQDRAGHDLMFRVAAAAHWAARPNTQLENR